jgi:hypothetical protein
MATNAARTEVALKKMRYSSLVRCIGQGLEEILQGWHRGTTMAMDFEKHYSPEDLRALDKEGRKKRRAFAGPPDLLSLPEALRLAGTYVDRTRGRLIRVAGSIKKDSVDHCAVGADPRWPAKPIVADGDRRVIYPHLQTAQEDQSGVRAPGPPAVRERR